MTGVHDCLEKLMAVPHPEWFCTTPMARMIVATLPRSRCRGRSIAAMNQRRSSAIRIRPDFHRLRVRTRPVRGLRTGKLSRRAVCCVASSSATATSNPARYPAGRLRDISNCPKNRQLRPKCQQPTRSPESTFEPETHMKGPTQTRSGKSACRPPQQMGRQRHLSGLQSVSFEFAPGKSYGFIASRSLVTADRSTWSTRARVAMVLHLPNHPEFVPQETWSTRAIKNRWLSAPPAILSFVLGKPGQTQRRAIVRRGRNKRVAR